MSIIVLRSRANHLVALIDIAWKHYDRSGKDQYLNIILDRLSPELANTRRMLNTMQAKFMVRYPYSHPSI